MICRIAVQAGIGALLWIPAWAQTGSPHDMSDDFRMSAWHIEEIRRQVKVPEMREHAWRLLEGITQPDSPADPEIPRWLRWPTREDIFPTHGVPNKRTSLIPQLEAPVQSILFSGFFKRPDLGRLPGATVLFNPPLAKDLRARRPVASAGGIPLQLNDPQTVWALNRYFDQKGVTGSQRQIPPVTRKAIALKPVWWLVENSDWRGVPIPVWTGLAANHNPAGDYLPDSFVEKVLVDPEGAPKCRKDPPPVCPDLGTVHQNPPVTEKLKVVKLSEFFYLRVCSCEEARRLTELGSFARVRPGDFVVLMAMHVMTREIDDWVWATFWWNGLGSDQDFALHRPPGLRAPWRNYMMDTTLDMVTPGNPADPKLIFNPWLELSLDDGRRSNCMSCHRSAAYPNAGKTAFGFVNPGAGPLAKATKLGFEWTIADYSFTALLAHMLSF